MKRIKIFAVLLILFLNSLYSQEYTQTIRGEVRDALTERTIPGASLVILNTDPIIGTTTCLDGLFRFENIPVGRVSIKVAMLGYNPVVLPNLLVSSGRELVLNISLEESVYELDEVNIIAHSANEPINEMAIVSARSFSIEQTERYAGSLGDPARMAQNFAGVSTAGDQRNDIIIRGNSPLGLAWRIEGVDVPNPNHFGSMGSTGGPVSMINNNLLANSDFYTGAFPAEFGNALAGAFDLRLRTGNNEKREYLGQVGFNGFELGAEGPFSKNSRASYIVNARYSTLQLLNLVGMDFGTGQAIPEYKDLSFNLNFPLKNGRFSVFGIGGDSYIEMLDSQGDSAQYGFSGTDLRFAAQTAVLGATHVHYFTENARLTTRLALTGLRNKVSIIDLDYDPDINVINEHDYEVKYSLSSKYSHRINSRNFFNTGVVYDFYDVFYKGEQYNRNHSRHFYYMNTHDYLTYMRIFGEWQHRFNNNITLNSGLHAGKLFFNNSYSIEPRTALKWQINNKHALSFGAGLHSQTQLKAVYFMEKLIDADNEIYERTNENLDFSKSMHLVLGYDVSIFKDHIVKLELYYQKLYDIPVSHLRPEYSIINSGGDFGFSVFHYNINAGTGENRGIEITIEKFLNQGFYYLLTGSIFDAGYKAYDGKWRNSQFNNNFVFNALAGYEWQFNQRVSLAADIKAVWAGGIRYVPIDEKESKLQDKVVYDWDNAYNERHPDYFRINARLTLRLNGENVNQEWGLDLQNLTNHQNVFTQNWNTTTKEVTTAYQMGFMPMMTYRVNF